MQENIKTMIKLFNNSNEFQKAVFIDCINDLLNGTFTFKSNVNLDEIPEWIYIKRLIKAVVQYINHHYPNPQEFLNDVKRVQEEQDKIIDKWAGKDTVWLLNVTKERIMFLKTLYWKEVKNAYDSHLWKDELDEIHSYRQLCLDILIDKNIIVELMDKNPELKIVVEDFLKSITIKKNGKLQMKPIKEMSDLPTREIFKNIKTVVGWERKLREWFKHLCDNISIQAYSYNKAELEYLLESVTWNKIIKDESSHRYLDKKIYIFYNWWEVSFEEWEKTYLILSEVFKSKNNWEVALWDIFPKLYWEEYEYSRHSQEKLKISSSIAWINRRFKQKSNGKRLLQFKGNVIKKLR